MEDSKRHQETFFFLTKKNKMFWEDKIMKLPERLQKVKQNPKYIFHVS